MIKFMKAQPYNTLHDLPTPADIAIEVIEFDNKIGVTIIGDGTLAIRRITPELHKGDGQTSSTFYLRVSFTLN